MSEAEFFDLSEKTVVVTGGAGLIGVALCEALAKFGADVVVVDTNQERGKQIADEIPGPAEYRSTDITVESEVQDLFESVAESRGGLDVLVNSAYPRTENYGQKYEDVTFEEWRNNIDLHLNSYFLTSHRASLIMKEQERGGSIINIGSIYGMQAPDFTVYNNTDITSPVEYSGIKGGIINMTKYMASYLGQYGIRANVLSPGGVFNNQDSTFVEQYEERTPLGRMAYPKDLQGAIVFLASDASQYITGHNLIVDGGWTIR